jgi:protein involved in polysaccharide export with SLBB domain
LFKYIEPEEQVFYSTEYKQDEIIRITIDEDWMKSDLADSILVGGYYKVTIHDRLEYLSLGQEVEVEGAVRKPGTYPVKQGMNLKDLLFQAGGLSRTADVEYVTFYKVIDDKEKGYFGYKTESPEIFRTSLVEDWMNSPMLDTIMVGKYRKIKFHRKGEFFQAGFVAVKGLVNKPGEYRILPNMNLKDLIYQAEGFSIQADLNHIELTRVVEQRDENGNITAIPIVVRNVVVDPNWQDDKELEKIEVNTFDQVFVRKDPNFELQESVYITGEVRVPGEYNKKIKAETLTSLIERANGLTDLAYVEGAVLRRDNIGAISIKLEKAMKRPKSKFNIPLQKGDELIIPPRLDVVSVVGNVLVPDTKLMFEKGNSRVKYYVNLSGGFERKTKKKQITVRYMNGSVKRTTSFFGIKNYPKVKQGSVITIPKKEEKAKNEGGGAGEERKPRISLEETVAAATGILTIILLIKSINSQ